MATKTKAKPKASKAKEAKPKATKKAAEKPKKVEKLLAEGSFVKFTGYRSQVSDEEAVFDTDDILYIVEVDETDDGVLYSAIKAQDVVEFEKNGDENVEGGQVAASEVSTLKGSALEKVKEKFTPVIAIGKLAELLEENGNAIEVAIELNNEIQETYFWLGGAIATILQSEAYLVENGGDYEGEDAFTEFTQAEFGFKASKARQLARIYTTFSSLDGFDPDRLAGIGWTLASKAEKYVTADNVDEVLELAADDDTNQRNIDFKMKEHFAVENTTASGRQASRGPTIVKRTMSFRLEEDSAESVELAIAQCMKQSGIQSEALALEKICVEWAQENVEAAGAKKRIESKARKAAALREKAEEKSAPKKKLKKK